MGKKRFRNLREVYDVYKKEGAWQAAVYGFDKSLFRLAIPYVSELIPGMLGFKNYKKLTEDLTLDDAGCFEKGLMISTCGMLSAGGEAARYVFTSIVYNETRSLEAALATYWFSSSFFSMRNLFSVDRFYKPGKLKKT